MLIIKGAMSIEEIIGKLCAWIDVSHWGLGIDFYSELGGQYVEIKLVRGISFTKTFEKKKSFDIPYGCITEGNYNDSTKEEIRKWVERMNNEYRKAYIKENGHEPIDR